VARPINQQTVVITGASSGIGRATALAFGRKGANVVAAARTEPALREVEEEINKNGGHAIAVDCDVAEYEPIERLANLAVERFGRIDTWVNNAGVSQYATVEQSTVEELERIIQVDLMGQIYGVKAVLPVMKRQNEGTIVNVSSELAWFSIPLMAGYCAAKHGVKGFTDSLRLELRRENSPIQVTEILPSGINTPFFAHARNKFSDHHPQPTPPIYQPEVVAEAILFAAEKPRREIVVGGGKLFTVLQRISPELVDWILLQNDYGVKGQISDMPDDRRDNLFAPAGGPSATHGPFDDKAWSSSEYTRVFEQHPALKPVVLGLGVLGVMLALRHGLRR
jgi:NAD(P)-dependent dehydrogenase (short-subunit alcohol dehydrogenase family)